MPYSAWLYPVAMGSSRVRSRPSKAASIRSSSERDCGSRQPERSISVALMPRLRSSSTVLWAE